MVTGVTISGRLTIVLTLITLISLAACGGGGGTPPNPTPTRITLTGTVTNGVNQAVAGAQVLLGFAETQTNASGVFSFANLQAGSYLVSIQDPQGNFDSRNLTLSAANTDFAFELPNPNPGYRIVVVNPPLNTQGAALDSAITLETTMAPDLAALEGGALSITPDVGPVDLSYNAQLISIQPLYQLPLDQTVIVELQQGTPAADSTALAHPVRWTFRTSASDTSPPRLISTAPVNGAANHPPNLSVSFGFNENVAVDAPSFSVSSADGQTLNARAIGRSVIVSAEAGWEILTDYQVTIRNVSDTSGNVLSTAQELRFTTGEQPANSDDIQADWNDTLDLIVFASSQNNSYDIFSIKPDGSELTQLTNLPGDELYPSLSVDGSLLTFQHRGDAGRWNVYVQNRENGTPQPVSADEFNDTQPTFTNTLSNDIIFVSDRVTPAGLYSMHFDGSNPVELDNEFNSSQSEPDAHPLLDTQILFSSNRGGTRDIWRKTVSAIDGSTINFNLTGDTISHEFAPSWNPDAGSFIYISDDGGTNNLWQSDAAGEFARQVTGFDVDLNYPEMSPFAGSLECVASLSNGPSGASLVLIDLVSGEITRHLTGPEAANQ